MCIVVEDLHLWVIDVNSLVLLNRGRRRDTCHLFLHYEISWYWLAETIGSGQEKVVIINKCFIVKDGRLGNFDLLLIIVHYEFIINIFFIYNIFWCILLYVVVLFHMLGVSQGPSWSCVVCCLRMQILGVCC